MHRGRVMLLLGENCEILMQRGQVILLLIEYCWILMQRGQVMYILSKDCGILMQRGWAMPLLVKHQRISMQKGRVMLLSGENFQVNINANIDAENGWDSEQIYSVELMYNSGTNHNDHQDNFSEISIEVHAILTILCDLCCFFRYFIWEYKLGRLVLYNIYRTITESPNSLRDQKKRKQQIIKVF